MDEQYNWDEVEKTIKSLGIPVKVEMGIDQSMIIFPLDYIKNSHPQYQAFLFLSFGSDFDI